MPDAYPIRVCSHAVPDRCRVGDPLRHPCHTGTVSGMVPRRRESPYVNSPDRTLGMGRIPGEDPAGHRSQTRDAYDQLAPVWADTTDDGPFNGHLERPALRGLIPQPLTGQTVMDAGCG